MNQKCSICSTVYPSYSNKMLKTEDKKDICIDCYHLVHDEIFVGDFSLELALKTITFIKEYEESLKAYLLLQHKCMIRDKLDINALLRNTYKNEVIISESVFKVPRQVQVFTRKGRLELLKVIIEKMDLSNLENIVIRDEGSQKTSSELYHRYINLVD